MLMGLPSHVAPLSVKTIQVPSSPERHRNQAAESLGLAPPDRLPCFCCHLLTAAFSLPLVSLAKYAATIDLHSHIVLIPFISAYLSSSAAKQLPREYVSLSWSATLLLIAGVAALLAAVGLFNLPLSQNDSLSLMALSFVCLLAAGGFLFLGRKWMAAAAFPFAFLIFMVPLPDGLVNWLETALEACFS